MTSLIACLTTGKGTWGHVNALIKGESWDKVFLVTNEFGMEKFTKDDNTEFILIDNKKPVSEIIDLIKKQLEGKINDTEVALNLVSGTGKEHMAILSAVLKLGLGVRLVVAEAESVREI
jgi:hypothetical protein